MFNLLVNNDLNIICDNYDLYKNDNHGNNSIHWASSNSAKFALKYLLLIFLMNISLI